MKKVSLLLLIELSLLAVFAILMKGGVEMVDLYVALIIAGRRTFSKVPDKFKAAVRTELAALGLDENGNPVEE